jgi:leader peptidase (prepilin peptidase) / N-methyltransferase
VLWLFPGLPGLISGITSLWPHATNILLIGFSTLLLGLLAHVSIIDARRMIVPDMSVMAIAGIGVLSGLVFHPEAIIWNICAAVGVAVILLIMRDLYFRICRRDGLGIGDIKLICAATIWIGHDGVSSMILIAAMTGILSAASLKLVRGRLKRLPFAPHLAAATWIVWCCGPILIVT